MAQVSIRQPADRRVDRAHPVRRGHTHHQHQHDKRPDRQVLAGVEIGDAGASLHESGLLAVEHFLDKGQRVGCARHHAEGRHRAPGRVRGERGRKHQELADKPVQNRKADQRQHGDDKERHHPGQPRSQAAVGRRVVGAVTLVQKAEQRQQRAADQALVDRLVDRTIEPGD